MQAPRLALRAPRWFLVTAGVAAGLFVARELGELIPDSLAASVAMFAAGLLVGLVLGLTWRLRVRNGASGAPPSRRLSP
jgi:hypothetical protein